MKSNWTWTSLKNLIAATSGNHDDVFLSVIDEEGTILCANAGMKRGLSLERKDRRMLNFLDHLHPENKEEFKRMIKDGKQSVFPPIELHIKKGQYHPMKWHVNAIDMPQNDQKKFLCIGYQLLDDRRLALYNELVRTHYQLILEGLGGIIFHNRQGEIIAVNKKAAAIFSSSLEELYKLKGVAPLWNNVWEIRDEKGEKVLFEETPFIRAFESGKVEKTTLQMPVRNGKTRWVHFSSQLLPLHDAAGGPVVVSSLMDVTQERELIKAVQEKDAMIKALLKETPNLSWVVDEESRLMFASDAFYKLFRIKEQESLGMKVTELLPLTVIEKVFDRHQQVLATGLPVHVSEQVTWANGVKYIAHINIFPLPGAGAGLVGGQATFLPDTSRLENELRTAQQRLLMISRATTDAIWEWDMQSGHIFRNETLMTMIGYQQDNSRGLSWWLRRIHPHDRDRVADTVKEATENNQQYWQEEYRFRCADGAYKHIRDKGFVVYENGLPVKMIGSLQDISGLKELEGKLMDERLQQQKENAEMVMKVQEKERSRISKELHDNVNQLLSTSRLFIDAINTKDDSQRQIKEKSVEYLQMAVDEIRKLSKELSSPHLQQNTLEDILHTMVEDINMTGRIKMKMDYDPQAEALSIGKKTTLFRIIQEQVKNIIRHSEATSAAISLHTGQGQVALSIEDNGKGFEPGQTHRGIGLANIQERSNYYNGKATISSGPGKGCILTVLLPCED